MVGGCNIGQGTQAKSLHTLGQKLVFAQELAWEWRLSWPLISILPRALLSFRNNPCAAEEEQPWHMRAPALKMHLDAEYLHHLSHRGIRVLAAWPWQSLLLQGLQPHRLLHQAAEHWGGCSAQAWLKQEFPLFSMWSAHSEFWQIHLGSGHPWAKSG